MGLIKNLPNCPFGRDGWPWNLEVDADIYDDAIDWPKISIVTPSFNQGKYIEETIRSVLLQNYPEIEYILIDGGSTDNTMKILNEYEKNITYWVSEKDRGQSEAINKGLKQCSGTIFNWLNSDDFLEPKALYHIAIAFINNISALAVSGKERAIYSNKDEIKINNGTNIKSSLEETLFFGYIDQPVTFFKKLCFDKIGPLNEEFHYTMDSEWWCRYLCEYGLDKIVNIKPILANFRHHNISKSKFGDLANPKFQKDRNTIHLSILKSLNSPSWLFDHYERKPRINIYDSEWEFNFINDSSLLDLFAQSMVQDLKNNGQIIKAIKPKLYSLRKRIKSRIFRIKYNNKS